jgi:hypothetical protein
MTGQEQAQKHQTGVATRLQGIAEKAQCRQNCSIKVYLQLNVAPVCAFMALIARPSSGRSRG